MEWKCGFIIDLRGSGCLTMAKIVTSCFADCNVTIGYSENDLERLDNLETFLTHLAGELDSEHGQAGCMGALEAVEEKL